jgi:hypothetical protein
MISASISTQGDDAPFSLTVLRVVEGAVGRGDGEVLGRPPVVGAMDVVRATGAAVAPVSWDAGVESGMVVAFEDA